MEGKIVEYVEKQRVTTAICLEESINSLRLLTPLNREIGLSKTRIVLVSQERYLTSNRQGMIKTLKEVVEKRESLKNNVDVLGLWELLSEERGTYNASTLAELCFSGEVTSHKQSAILRALLEEKIHFKLRGHKFEVMSKEYIERLMRQKVKEDERIKKIEEAANWLNAVYLGKDVTPPQKKDEYINILKEWCVFQEEAPQAPPPRKTYSPGQAKMAKEILDKAHLSTDNAFRVLVNLGVFSKHENVLLPRYGIRVRFPDEVKSETSLLIKTIPDFLKDREDLTKLYTFTIDGPETRDFDDALSIEEKDGHYRIGVHITDLTPFIPPKSKLDEEARERGTAIYMPDGRIPMFPEEIPDELGSLKKGQIKPTMSFLVDLDSNSNILGYRILPSLIRVDARFTYDEVNELLTKDIYPVRNPWLGDRDEKNKFSSISTGPNAPSEFSNGVYLKKLHQLALQFRQRRLSQGGMVITLPELIISFLPQDTLEVKQRNPEQPSRILVAEFMIMTNYITASFLHENSIPAIYRGQPQPRERIMDGTSQDLFTTYLQRKLLNRPQLDTRPVFHHILGLEKYTAATSPLRRYLDLIIQRQLVYYLREKKPLYIEKDFSPLIPHLEECSRRTLTVCNQRLKYWLLTHLKQQIKHIIEAYILEKIPRGYRILLSEYLLETELINSKEHFRQGDKVRVKIEAVNPKKQFLKVVLG